MKYFAKYIDFVILFICLDFEKTQDFVNKVLNWSLTKKI